MWNNILATVVPPCGTPDGSGLITPCHAADLIALFQNFMHFLLVDILLPVAVLSLAFVGFQYITSAGNPGKLSKVTETLWDILYGIFIALAAYAIISTVFNVLVRPEANPFVAGKITEPNPGLGSGSGGGTSIPRPAGGVGSGVNTGAGFETGAGAETGPGVDTGTGFTVSPGESTGSGVNTGFGSQSGGVNTGSGFNTGQGFVVGGGSSTKSR